MGIFIKVDIETEASVKVTTDKNVYNYVCTPGHPYIKSYTAQYIIDTYVGVIVTDIICEGNMLQILTHNGAISIFAEDKHEDNIEWSGDIFPKGEK